MGFLVSPGVQVREIDLTNVVPAVSTSIVAIAGPFEKGPVSTVTAISSSRMNWYRFLVNPKGIILNFSSPLQTSCSMVMHYEWFVQSQAL